MAGEPREFGAYYLLRRLGVGGMAETFEATRIGAGGFEQRVCLKRVLPAFSGDLEFVSHFRREAVLAAQLRHTNVVGVIDVGEIDDVHYMTLELVDGLDLRSLLKSSPGERLPPDTVALIALDLAYALEHAHASLVHRDISPSNILLSRSGEAKLADFGIAKALDDAKATASRSARGKVPYMSPEHMRGEAVDGRADLFSLGVVLFEAVAGVRPFDGAHDVETMQKILEGNRRSLEEVAPHAPKELREIIERLLEVDPAVRTPSAARLIEELGTVAPAPALRRQLASTIESHRGGPNARMHVRAREEERDTELSRPPSPMATGAREHLAPSPRKPPRFGRAVMLASILVLSFVALAAGAGWLERKEEAPGPVAAAGTGTGAGAAPGSVAAPVAVAGSVPVPAPESVAVPESVSMPGTASPARARKGWVHVIVQPWGNVWIDGAFMGRAPVKARLSKGRHVVKVGRELPSQTRVVRVEAGARKELEIKLPE
ncbi:MAG: protein kinase [Myxococcales bacterium]|nr:protein kinase [Myxococcales bacterium]